MEYRRMGRTGLRVSTICLGTMTFGFQTDEAAALRIMDAAWDAARERRRAARTEANSGDSAEG